ncbi:hypothetical protein C8R43DRAFT_1068046 [Mycena crocata]|nr:hypothetical protein C8R43DRAFT_1068046 [Mycena crocata]
MSSPFASRLGTNYCPTDDEAADIRSLLIEPKRCLDTLDEKIADMQRAIDELAQERDSLAGYLDAHKALLSPIRRMPLDIVQEIFTACIPTSRNCAMVASEAPVLLGRICSSWRSISLSTPRLWSKLHIVDTSRPIWASAVVQRMYEVKRRQRLETTKMWLSRSGQCPVSISLLGGTEYEANSADFIHALLPFAPRWENIDLAIRGTEFKALSHLGKSDVPMLKSFGIVETHHLGGGRWDSLRFVHGSLLSSLSINSEALSASLLLQPLQWERLIHLSIARNCVLSSQAALQILSRCPFLQTLQLLTHDDDRNDNGTGHPTLTHNSIHTLDFTCSGTPGDPTRFLGHISLPKLRKFKFRGGYYNVEDNAIVSTFLVTCPILENLDINVEALDKGSRAQLFHGLAPTVAKFYLSDSEVDDADVTGMEWQPIDDDILNLLTPSSVSPLRSCPALEELWVSNCRTFNDRTLLRFITARMTLAQPCTLKRVVCKFDREMEVDIKPDLQPFVDAGLSVELTYPAPVVKNFSPWKGLKDVSDR